MKETSRIELPYWLPFDFHPFRKYKDFKLQSLQFQIKSEPQRLWQRRSTFLHTGVYRDSSMESHLRSTLDKSISCVQRSIVHNSVVDLFQSLQFQIVWITEGLWQLYPVDLSPYTSLPEVPRQRSIWNKIQYLRFTILICLSRCRIWETLNPSGCCKSDLTPYTSAAQVQGLIATGSSAQSSIIHNVTVGLLQSLQLQSDSEALRLWQSRPVALLTRVYLWNLTNADQVSAGLESPSFVEVGPYVYEWV